MNEKIYREKNYHYRVKRGESEIIRYEGMGEIVRIPNMLGGRAVTSIDREAFAGNKTIRCVSFPKTMRRIGEGAFRTCESLEEAWFNYELKVIEDHAFQACRNLGNVVLPMKTAVSELAFSGCENIRKFRLCMLGTFNHGRSTDIWSQKRMLIRGFEADS